jgi:hypothetical protein
MTHEALQQRYRALETATASRLSSFNLLIREERAKKTVDKDRLDYLKGKRKEIEKSLNFIRETLKKPDLSVMTYQEICDTYMNFSANY